MGITPSANVNIYTIFDGALTTAFAPAGSTTYITRQCEAIQKHVNKLIELKLLYKSPSLEGSQGPSIHTINITFPEQDI